MGYGNHMVAWHPTDAVFVSGTPLTLPTIDVWSMDGRRQHQLTAHDRGTYGLTWNPAGTILATSGSRHDVMLWSYPDWQLIGHITLPRTTWGILRLAWSADGHLLAAYARDLVMTLECTRTAPTAGSVHILNHTSAFGLRLPIGAWHPTHPLFVQFTSLSKTQSIMHRSDDPRQPPHAQQLTLPSTAEVCWIANGERLALRGEEHVVVIDGVGRLLEQYSVSSTWVWEQGLAWNPQSPIGVIVDGSQLVFLDAHGAPAKTIPAHTREVAALAWNHAGTVLASGSWDRTIKLWDSTGQLLHVLEGHMDAVFTLAWRPDDTQLASVSRAYDLLLWDSAAV